MNVTSVIKSQFHASLDMLAAAVEACPDDAWDRSEDRNRSWHLVYHTLFYVHLYLQPTESDFEPWAKHADEYSMMGHEPWPPIDLPEAATLSKSDALAYLSFCRGQVDARTASVDLDATSGFPWLPMNKLELQLYSIRHVMQHVGEMYERVAKTTGADLDWVGMHPGAREST